MIAADSAGDSVDIDTSMRLVPLTTPTLRLERISATLSSASKSRGKLSSSGWAVRAASSTVGWPMILTWVSRNSGKLPPSTPPKRARLAGSTRTREKAM